MYLLVVGGNPNAAYEAAARRRLGGQCLFLGRRSDLPAIYAAADVCVLPSLLESFGLPILEAMACGVPGIVGAEAGVAEIITDGEDGLLLRNPRDPAELAAKLIALLGDPQLRARMGAQARATAERYSWDSIARQFEATCADLRVGIPAAA